MLPENNKLYTGFEDSLTWQSAACDCSCLKSSLHLNGQQNVTGWCIVYYQANHPPPPPKKPKQKTRESSLILLSLLWNIEIVSCCWRSGWHVLRKLQPVVLVLWCMTPGRLPVSVQGLTEVICSSTRRCREGINIMHLSLLPACRDASKCWCSPLIPPPLSHC